MSNLKNKECEEGNMEKKENLGEHLGETKWYYILLMMMKNLQEKDIII